MVEQTQHEKIREMVFGDDGPNPFQGVNFAGYAKDLQGWNSTDPGIEEVLRKSGASFVAELGTWKGASAIHMAEYMTRTKPGPVTVVCVDTWLGSLEHWTIPRWKRELNIEYGYPNLYWQFLTNVIETGYTDVIVPVPMTTTTAGTWFAREGLRFDAVYVDASHEEQDVLQDLQTWWPLVRIGGALLGDDFSSWENVRNAVNKFRNQVTPASFHVYEGVSGIWVMWK